MHRSSRLTALLMAELRALVERIWPTAEAVTCMIFKSIHAQRLNDVYAQLVGLTAPETQVHFRPRICVESVPHGFLSLIRSPPTSQRLIGHCKLSYCVGEWVNLWQVDVNVERMGLM